MFLIIFNHLTINLLDKFRIPNQGISLIHNNFKSEAYEYYLKGKYLFENMVYRTFLDNIF